MTAFIYAYVYQGMKTRTEIMRGDEDMVGATTAVPERKLRRKLVDGGGDERAGVANGWESINGAEIAGYVNGDEEEIGLPWVQRPKRALHQSPVNSNLRRKQMGAATFVR